MTRRRGKTAIFIDGTNLNATSKALGFYIDFQRLLSQFRGNRLMRAFYYSALAEQDPSMRPFLDWLSYNGYSVITKLAKEFVNAEGRRKVKNSMEIELVVNAMELGS